jgi:hypothetical protein
MGSIRGRDNYGTFLNATASRPAPGPTQPPIQWVQGALTPEVKRLGRDADHSPPSTAEVKNMWSYTSTPQYVFMAWWSVKHESTRTALPLFFLPSFLSSLFFLLYSSPFLFLQLSFSLYFASCFPPFIISFFLKRYWHGLQSDILYRRSAARLLRGLPPFVNREP